MLDSLANGVHLLQDLEDLGRGLWALQLLPVEHLLLQLADGLGRLGEGLGHPAVAAAVAGGDKVSHSTALQEGGGGNRLLAKELSEGHHLHQTQTDHRRLGVVPKAQAIAEARTHRHDVLEKKKEKEKRWWCNEGGSDWCG